MVESIIQGHRILDDEKFRLVRGPAYNYNFSRVDGKMARWGIDLEDDPIVSPIGPEIADIAVSRDGCQANCPFCYKDSQPTEAKNMSLDMFQDILFNLGSNVTQVALGLTDLDANPDLLGIMEYSRSKGVIPNLTINGCGIKYLEEVAKLAGAISVSIYPHTIKDGCLKVLADLRKMNFCQVNAHLLMAEEYKDFLMEIAATLKPMDLHAVVFLGLKKKGRGKNFNPVSYETFVKIVNHYERLGIRYGFDSCSAPKYEKYVRETKGSVADLLLQNCEPCESGLFSLYVNVDGDIYPCSFCEGELDPLSLDDKSDFWISSKIIEWRQTLLRNNRRCPIYDLGDL